MGVFRTFIDNNKFGPEDLPAFEAKLFFDGSNKRAKLERFVILLFLALMAITYIPQLSLIFIQNWYSVV